MCRKVLIVLLATLLSGCLGLPTLGITPTTVPKPKMLLPTATATSTLVVVKITGDVYVRDDQGNIKGWLYKADELYSFCSGDWCKIHSGIYSSYYFWRGCASDNPVHKSCQAR